MAWNVVILGGGFGGLYAARKLERSLPPHAAKVTIVTDVNFMLYTPLLPGAAAGTLQDITAFAATTLTTGQNISPIIFRGVHYEVRRVQTVADLFGPGNEAAPPGLDSEQE